MPTSRSTEQRSRVLAAVTVLVLALLVSLALFVGRTACTSAVASDASIADAERAAHELASSSRIPHAPTAARTTSTDVVAPIRARVFDELTGEVVPFVDVEIALGELVETRPAAADGTLASTIAFPSGRVRATVRDDGVVVGTTEWDHDADADVVERRIAVPIGPTIPLTSIDDAAQDEHAWRARIVERAHPDGVIGEISVREGGFLLPERPLGMHDDATWSWTRVREGTPRWIRYPRHERSPDLVWMPTLVVRDEVRNRKDAIPLRSTRGVHAPVAVRTTEFARARVKIARAAADADAPMRAMVHDLRDGAVEQFERRADVFDEVVVGADGTFEVADLEPGTKRVVAWSDTERADHTFLLASGPSDVVTMRAVRAGEGASAATSSSSVFESAESGRFVATARLAAGERRMRARYATGAMAEVSRALQMTAAGTDLVLGYDWSGAPVKGARWIRHRWNSPEGSTSRSTTVSFGPTGRTYGSVSTSTAFSLVADVDFAWCAWMDGMRPVFGTHESFRAVGDGSRETDVAFERGYGVRIFLRVGAPDDESWPWSKFPASVADPARRGSDEAAVVLRALLAAPAVEGVVARVDGRDAVTSDANGELRIVEPFAPARITLMGSGWKLVALRHMQFRREYVAWLRRDP